MRRDIQMSVLTALNMFEPERWPSVVDLLCTVYPDIAPERYGSYEPLREVFDPAHPEHFIAGMSHSVFWKRRSPRCAGTWFPGTQRGWIHADVTVRIDADKADLSKLIEFVLGASKELRADFACLHQMVEQDIPIAQATNTGGRLDSKTGACSLIVTTHALRRCIPDLYWATVFGPPYVELFGRERLLSAPAPVVHELEGGAVYIQLSDKPSDFLTDFPRVDAIRQRVKAHLDSNAFFDPSAPADHAYNTPCFNLQPPPASMQAAFPGSDGKLVTAQTQTEPGESAPDLLKMITTYADNAVHIARELFGVELDYSAESVQAVEEKKH